MNRPSLKVKVSVRAKWPTAPARSLLVGIDVGSTTVKAVARSAASRSLLFHTYRRHEGRQGEAVLALLRDLRAELPAADSDLHLYLTGSGGQAIAELLGGRFVQEVAAVTAAVEAFHPDVRSVIELGGQDAKMVFFDALDQAGQRKKIATMNDKCAGGTGVVIEKIASRLHIPLAELCANRYDGVPIHTVAGKCGVFAETDITGLQKQGVPSDQLMASLYHAIVLQNLSVLTRGHTVWPNVLLLGGPNTFFPGLRAAWQTGLEDLWRRKQVPLRPGAAVDDLIRVPVNAELYAAMGAIEFCGNDAGQVSSYLGTEALEWVLKKRSAGIDTKKEALEGLCASDEERNEFLQRYRPLETRQRARSGEPLRVYLGVDGGSTSTKAVALDEDGEPLVSSYRLSEFDPVADAVAVLGQVREQLNAIAPSFEILGFGATGYSRSLLGRALGADLEIVETVAHAKSSLHIFPDVDSIIDVGGQDIKIILLRNGAVRDFKLNTQCSAGNGYFLQAAASQLGIPIEKFAETAFRARRMPQFSYGCAVFLQSDIVNFQRQGWRPEEILAGLAAVLPKNVFLYVAGVSNTATLGRHFVLQGGTQRNMAVVKAEVDFISSHYHGDGAPIIAVHPHASTAGAIGAALEARERHEEGHPSVFPGFDYLDRLKYAIRRDEGTRCSFCANRCMRTFVEFGGNPQSNPAQKRVIVATCERGEAENAAEASRVQSAWRALGESHPNYVRMAGIEAWKPTNVPVVTGKRCWWSRRYAAGSSHHREQIHIGIPRVLNLYTYAPLFSAYFESLGVPAKNLHYSHFSDSKRYLQASGFLPIDPCYPSKVAVSHVYELVESAEKQKLDAIFLPIFDMLTSPLTGCEGANACPSGSATPEAVKAAFSRTVNWFQRANIEYIDPVLDLSDRALFRYQMFEAWKDMLKLDWDEHARAVDIAFGVWENFEARFRSMALATLNEIERSGEVGLVMLGRPYHHDPGLNQGILEELQKKGYPIFSQSLLPLDEALLERLFGSEVESGAICSPFDLSDVWKHTFSVSSNHKLWAAKFVARHPNLVSVELSNFKCGHDAFINRTIEQIIEQSGKPHFSFRDLDENRPLASIRIRVETIDYFLQRYRRSLPNTAGRRQPGHYPMVAPTTRQEVSLL